MLLPLMSCGPAAGRKLPPPHPAGRRRQGRWRASREPRLRSWAHCARHRAPACQCCAKYRGQLGEGPVVRLGASRQLLRCLQEVTRLCEGPCGSAIFHHLPFASSCADHVPGVTRARFYGARLEQQSMSGAAACRAAALSKGAHKHGCSSTAPHMSRKQVHSCLKACLEAVAAPQRRTKGFGLRHHTSTQSHCIGCRDVLQACLGVAAARQRRGAPRMFWAHAVPQSAQAPAPPALAQILR